MTDTTPGLFALAREASRCVALHTQTLAPDRPIPIRAVAHDTSTSMTASKQGKSAVGFMDLATETRLEIYGWLFTTSTHNLHAYCPEVRSLAATAVETMGCPSVSSKVATALLRVSKKIYDEALPVMLDNLHYVVRSGRLARGEFYITLKDLCDMTEITSRVRSLTLTATLDLPTFLGRGGYIGRDMSNMAQLIRKCLPKVSELRVHLDAQWSFDGIGKWRVPDRSAFEVMAPLVEYAGLATTVHIGLHVPERLRLEMEDEDEQACAGWVEGAVGYLNGEAEKKGKKVRFAVWE